MIAVVLFTSGILYLITHTDHRIIRISSNPWVGYTPFIYAQEKGWLDNTPFRFIWLEDLSDNSRMYERGFTQGFTATQYELLHFKNYTHIKPVFLIDRSNGADAILSNRSLEQLRKTGGIIPVYLELGSLNEDFFNEFVKEYKLTKLHFSLIDSSQKTIEQLNKKHTPVIVISYAPYLSRLLKQGYLTIASTADMHTFIVFDALFIDEQYTTGNNTDYQNLRRIFNHALQHLRMYPHEYYQVVHGYLEGQSYDEFMKTVAQIEWINDGDKTRYLQLLNRQHIQTDRVLP